MRREKQILARRRKLLRDSKSEDDGAPHILARRRQLLRDPESEEEALPGYKYERPDNPLILVRPPPRLPSVESTVRFGFGPVDRHFPIRILRATALRGSDHPEVFGRRSVNGKCKYDSHVSYMSTFTRKWRRPRPRRRLKMTS